MGARARIAEFPQIAIPTVISADSGGRTPEPARQPRPEQERDRHDHDDREDAGTAHLDQLRHRQPRTEQHDPDPQREPCGDRRPGKQSRTDGSHAADREADRQGDGRLETELERRPDEPGDGRDDDAGKQTGQHRAEARQRNVSGQSRTRGGLSRSNMWTVSTNRTCLV